MGFRQLHTLELTGWKGGTGDARTGALVRAVERRLAEPSTELPDARPTPKRLARVLEEKGHELWWDRRLDGGEEFSAEIEAELQKAGAVLVAWSEHSVRSRWVRDEAGIGADTGRLVPLSIDGAPVERTLRLGRAQVNVAAGAYSGVAVAAAVAMSALLSVGVSRP